jgi:hypothetical protein
LEAPKQIQEQTKEKLIAINWGTTYNRLYSGKEKEIEDKLALVAKKLIKRNYGQPVYLQYPLDTV